MQTHNIELSFKGTRNYIQGADLFNAMLNCFDNKTLSDIHFTIHKMIFNNKGQIHITNKPDELKNLPLPPSATARLIADSEHYWLALVFINETPVGPKRQNFDEQVLIKQCDLQDDSILLKNKSPYTYMETVVSMHKNLLETLYPNRGKWLFTKLFLKHYQADTDSINVTLDQNFNFKLVKSKLLTDGKPAGDIYFSLQIDE